MASWHKKVRKSSSQRKKRRSTKSTRGFGFGGSRKASPKKKGSPKGGGVKSINRPKGKGVFKKREEYEYDCLSTRQRHGKYRRKVSDNLRRVRNSQGNMVKERVAFKVCHKKLNDWQKKSAWYKKYTTKHKQAPKGPYVSCDKQAQGKVQYTYKLKNWSDSLKEARIALVAAGEIPDQKGTKWCIYPTKTAKKFSGPGKTTLEEMSKHGKTLYDRAKKIYKDKFEDMARKGGGTLADPKLQMKLTAKPKPKKGKAPKEKKSTPKKVTPKAKPKAKPKTKPKKSAKGGKGAAPKSPIGSKSRGAMPRKDLAETYGY